MRRSWWIFGVALTVMIVLAARAVRSSPEPAIQQVVPMRFAPAPRHEFNESDAISRLRAYLASYDPYDVPRDCLSVRSNGYRVGATRWRSWITVPCSLERSAAGASTPSPAPSPVSGRPQSGSISSCFSSLFSSCTQSRFRSRWHGEKFDLRFRHQLEPPDRDRREC